MGFMVEGYFPGESLFTAFDVFPDLFDIESKGDDVFAHLFLKFISIYLYQDDEIYKKISDAPK